MGSSIKRSRTAAAMSSLPSVAAALFGLLGATGYASSADLSPAPAPVPIVAPAVYNWNGLYLGLNAGYGFGTDTTTASGGGVSASASTNVPGFVGGAQIGVNYQTGAVVWEFEADFDASTQNRHWPPGSCRAQARCRGLQRYAVEWAWPSTGSLFMRRRVAQAAS